MDELEEVKDIFDKIASISAKTSKETIIKQNKDNELFKECLKFLLDSNVVTGLSTKKMSKNVPMSQLTFENIEDAFDYIKQHNTGTDANISIIKTFCHRQGECKEFCEGLFTKSLKIGCDAKTVNKVIPNLIPTFDIMLGSKFDLNKTPKETMFFTEKCDGLRCFTSIIDDVVTMKTRQNKIIEGLVDIENNIKELGLNGYCLDGELISIGSNYETVYKDTIKKVNNKNKVKHGVKYILFDIVPIDEFNNKKGKLKYSERRKILDNIKINEFIEVLPVLYKGDNVNVALGILDKYRDLGAEGLMCNLDEPYEFKRSKTLLKLKVMDTCDLKVIGFEEGQGRLSGTLGKIICDYKGFELGVGSGFTDSMRYEIWNNKDKYLNCIAEISYFEETNNDQGGLSLRFPIFKQWRFDKDNISYE